MMECAQVFIIFQESLPEVEVDRVSGVDVLEVISLLNQLLRVCKSPGCLNTDLTRTKTTFRSDSRQKMAPASTYSCEIKE